MDKKKKTVIIAIGAVLAILIIVLGYNYVKYRTYCHEHFQPNTNINGIDCSGLTVDETIDKLTSEWNTHEFTVTSGDDTMIVLTDLDFTYKIEKKVKSAMAKASKFPLFNRVFSRSKALTIAMTPDTENETFNKQIDTLDIFSTKGKTKTVNAYVDMSNTDFKIVKEVYGNNIDRHTFVKEIGKLIAKDTWSLEYEEENFYEIPTVTSDSQELKDLQEYGKKYLCQKITYEVGGTEVTLTPAQLNEMITVSEDGVKSVNKKGVKSFVKSLAEKYNTLGKDFNFSSTARGTVYVIGRTYGYSIDQSKEIKTLISNLEKGEDVTREPVYAQEGWGWSNGGVGNTYVEIDIGAQHLWYYKNGELIVSSDIVTGDLAAGHATPRGAYYLVYKSSDATLKGENDDGSKYETPVKYWMPFNGGIGMHDASWRSKFGGSIYKKGGSHGCVNMPSSKAGALYNNISAGCPVIVY